MDKRIVLTGAIFIFLGIILGAFAAHGLKNIVPEEKYIIIFEKGVRYQMYMGLGFLIVGFNASKVALSLRLFYWFGLLGVIIFSGLLYLLSITQIKVLGAIVPIGGTLMILSWLLLIIKIWKQKSTKDS
ncbi:MAG: DUF423 domain-containing protein [Crocinitomicaceae bacterium]|nr:DUF423 domain-containing protein [Crocinitomicaceae bacterium]